MGNQVLSTRRITKILGIYNLGFMHICLNWVNKIILSFLFPYTSMMIYLCCCLSVCLSILKTKSSYTITSNFIFKMINEKKIAVSMMKWGNFVWPFGYELHRWTTFIELKIGNFAADNSRRVTVFSSPESMATSTFVLKWHSLTTKTKLNAIFLLWSPFQNCEI